MMWLALLWMAAASAAPVQVTGKIDSLEYTLLDGVNRSRVFLIPTGSAKMQFAFILHGSQHGGESHVPELAAKLLECIMEYRDTTIEYEAVSSPPVPGDPVAEVRGAVLPVVSNVYCDGAWAW